MKGILVFVLSHNVLQSKKFFLNSSSHLEELEWSHINITFVPP